MLVKEIPIPTVTTAARVRYGLLCALEVCSDKEWRTWAARWLDGSNRSAAAAWAAWAAAWAAAEMDLRLDEIAERAVTEERVFAENNGRGGVA